MGASPIFCPSIQGPAVFWWGPILRHIFGILDTPAIFFLYKYTQFIRTKFYQNFIIFHNTKIWTSEKIFDNGFNILYMKLYLKINIQFMGGAEFG